MQRQCTLYVPDEHRAQAPHVTAGHHSLDQPKEVLEISQSQRTYFSGIKLARSIAMLPAGSVVWS